MKMAEKTHPSFHGLPITNLVFTDVKLGRGADATVFQVEWNGTTCAAKRLHDILLEDDSPGGADKLIGNFEAECLTWSKLRHPGVVQFLGVHFERNSRLPVLVMELMDISLRTYLEDHSKEEFPLNLKAFVLRQVTQALAYLHSQNPPLVHHDLSSNNVLLNVVSFVTKVSDFGMSRAINPSALSRKSSIKGTQAFMAPEALHDPPRYNEKLDVFSFGNIILSTLTHEWPNPGPPTRYEGDTFVAITELQRRDRYVAVFTAQEKQLFLPTVNQCLENRPDKRPSSVMLVRELRRIESSLPTGSHVAAPIEHLQQQLSAKEEECRQKDEMIREKEEALREKDEVVRERVKSLGQKEQVIREREEALRKKYEEVTEKGKALGQKEEAIREIEKLFREKNAEVIEKGKALRQKEEAIREQEKVLKEKDVALREKEAELQSLRNAIKERDSTAPGKVKQLAAAQKGDEEDDGDVYTVHYVDEAMIKQHLDAKIHQMSREEAKTALSSRMVDGMFLLRVSQRSGWQLVISVWYKTECKHFKIFHVEDKGFSLISPTFFANVTDLILHYMTENLPKSTFHLSHPWS